MSESGSVSRGLRRLLQLRLLEEEQSRVALEAAVGELQRLEEGVARAIEQSRHSRQLIRKAIQSDNLPDRLAGLEVGYAATRQSHSFSAAVGPSLQAVNLLREKYQEVRVERRQVETLVQEAEAAAALRADRSSQQFADDWYGSRRQGLASASVRAKSRLEDKSTQTR
jgi:flagellar biosynthesis chaperone FliJ